MKTTPKPPNVGKGYRQLNGGEIKNQDDEFLFGGEWVKTTEAGKRVFGDCIYRRKLAKRPRKKRVSKAEIFDWLEQWKISRRYHLNNFTKQEQKAFAAIRRIVRNARGI